MTHPAFAGLELIETAVVVLDTGRIVCHLNTAAENLFELSARETIGRPLSACFSEPAEILAALDAAEKQNASVTEHDVALAVRLGHTIHVGFTVRDIESPAFTVLEFRHTDQQRKIANEERLAAQQVANRQLIRNLAHEIKNPLGGIRGAAQLLKKELPDPALTEYTQVIVDEVDRLQSLLDKLLTPHRLPQLGEVNIHEVLERVRSVLLAEFPNGLAVRRDYDTSAPDLFGDKEQLIQAVLNIVRNAAQAMRGAGQIVLKTRVARQVTLNRRRFPLGLTLEITDNGPGIPEHIRETLFYPLISARPGGTGIGLHLAHTFIQQHNGTIVFDSETGRTSFTITLPLNGWIPVDGKNNK
ncbi:nitrogen regulation protein NR(II) [Chitinimonas sp. BJB300]|uniref:nitrogen regulation protein NR(II) n=1 Tax=Chitinimonas sp. BJB300 TaxID=1559339 RepID=UPI000C0D9F85|nr:nitrogen regulation protein NR(II) [Chitinimonas sp. BJB300]PHV10369.1 PAS domain-containing sensor histidine kinase [Chitinimonas sp. BJB300]TSJ91035.1 PAS domain-containing protein [Chitinimonas sp. BJB300]